MNNGINIIKKIKNIQQDLSNLQSEVSNHANSSEFDSKINNLTSKLTEETKRLEEMVNYKEFRMHKPFNKVIVLSAGTTQYDLKLYFNYELMVIRLNGIPLIHKSESATNYNYYNTDTIIHFKEPLKQDSVLQIKSYSALDLKLNINKQFVYEDYTSEFGQKLKRLKQEIWTGDIPKMVEYFYDENKPSRIIKERVTKKDGTYERSYSYDENGIKSVSDSGVDDFFVYRLYTTRSLDRTDISVDNLTEAIIEHNLNIMYPFVQVWHDSKLVICDIECIDENNIKILSPFEPISGFIIVRR
jgi:hypothetical protein